MVSPSDDNVNVDAAAIPTPAGTNTGHPSPSSSPSNQNQNDLSSADMLEAMNPHVTGDQDGDDIAADADDMTDVDADEGGKKKSSRGSTFVSEEMTLLSRAFMETSEDAAKGTDQTGDTFWNSCFGAYDQLRIHTNNINTNVPGWKPLPPRTLESIRSAWKRRIQPAVQKFAGIVSTNPPDSGELKDDAKMDLYYKKVREMYKNRAVNWKNLPKTFNALMPSYYFLRDHPKFEVHFPTTGEDSELGPPSVRKAVATKRKAPPPRQQRPSGRQAKKAGDSIDFVVHKVSEKVSQQSVQPSAQPNWDMMMQHLVNAGRTMEAMARHQVMSSAPSPQKKKYFEDVMVANALDAQNQRQKAELEQQQLLIAAERAKVEMLELQARKNSVAPAPAPASVCATTDAEDNGCCSWPECRHPNNDPAPELCNKCNRGNLHHACMISWICETGHEECTIKQCYNCWSKEYL